MAQLDHLVFAVADLEAARGWFEEATGVAPAVGGAHPGRGTHNALASLGAAYIELIAPDPGQPDPDGPRPFGLDDVTGDGLVAFAVRPDGGDPIDELAGRARAAGYNPGPVIAMSRRRPDGAELHWRNTLPPAAAGGVIPFVIDWGATDLPSETSPGGLDLTSFDVWHPDPDSVVAAHRALGFTAAVGRRDDAGLAASVRGPLGTLSLGAAPRHPDR